MEFFDLEVSNKPILSDTTEENDRKVKEFIRKYPDKKIIVTTKVLSVMTMISIRDDDDNGSSKSQSRNYRLPD